MHTFLVAIASLAITLVSVAPVLELAHHVVAPIVKRQMEPVKSLECYTMDVVSASMTQESAWLVRTDMFIQVQETPLVQNALKIACHARAQQSAQSRLQGTILTLRQRGLLLVVLDVTSVRALVSVRFASQATCFLPKKVAYHAVMVVVYVTPMDALPASLAMLSTQEAPVKNVEQVAPPALTINASFRINAYLLDANMVIIITRI